MLINQTLAHTDFLEQASRLVHRSSLWQRQMTLGPGPEFCLLGSGGIEAPEAFSPVSIELRQVWPVGQDGILRADGIGPPCVESCAGVETTATMTV